MSTLYLTLKKGEAKTLKFIYTKSSAAVDMTDAIFAFIAKADKDDATYAISKVDGDFDKTDIATGIVRVTLSKTDLDIDPANYVAEVRAYFSDLAIDLSSDIEMEIVSPVYHG